MKINYLNVVFWFDLGENYYILLENLQKIFSEEFNKFELNNRSNNIFSPIIFATNPIKMSSLVVNSVNLQYILENVTKESFSNFKDNCELLFDMLEKNNIKVLHTSLSINYEIVSVNAFNKITDNIFSDSLKHKNMIDASIKLSKIHEDIFYKIITLHNKKKIKVPKVISESGKEVPLPLISLKKAEVENELIDIVYEINDKYMFDNSDNYNTTQFYLNKIIYLLFNDYEDDLNNLLDKGEF